jgi:hypothetical protein
MQVRKQGSKGEVEIREVSLTEFYDNAPEIFNRVRDLEECYLVMKRGKPLSLIIPVPGALQEKFGGHDIPGKPIEAPDFAQTDPDNPNVVYVQFNRR